MESYTTNTTHSNTRHKVNEHPLHELQSDSTTKYWTYINKKNQRDDPIKEAQRQTRPSNLHECTSSDLFDLKHREKLTNDLLVYRSVSVHETQHINKCYNIQNEITRLETTNKRLKNELSMKTFSHDDPLDGLTGQIQTLTQQNGRLSAAVRSFRIEKDILTKGRMDIDREDQESVSEVERHLKAIRHKLHNRELRIKDLQKKLDMISDKPLLVMGPTCVQQHNEVLKIENLRLKSEVDTLRLRLKGLDQNGGEITTPRWAETLIVADENLQLDHLIYPNQKLIEKLHSVKEDINRRSYRRPGTIQSICVPSISMDSYNGDSQKLTAKKQLSNRLVTENLDLNIEINQIKGEIQVRQSAHPTDNQFNVKTLTYTIPTHPICSPPIERQLITNIQVNSNKPTKRNIHNTHNGTIKVHRISQPLRTQDPSVNDHRIKGNIERYSFGKDTSESDLCKQDKDTRDYSRAVPYNGNNSIYRQSEYEDDRLGRNRIGSQSADRKVKRYIITNDSYKDEYAETMSELQVLERAITEG